MTNSKSAFRHDPIPFKDENGLDCLRVPLDRRGKQYAIVGAHDYQRVRRSGATGTWYVDSAAKGRYYVRTCVPVRSGRNVPLMPARLITGAGPRSIVRYVNGDRFDLRPWNLVLKRGRSKHTDIDLAITAASAKRQGGEA